MVIKKLISYILLSSFILACSPQTGDVSPQTDETIAESLKEPIKADLILSNAKVYSLNWDEPGLDGKPAANAPYDQNGWHPDADTVAIANGKILFVGDAKEASIYQGENTKVENLNGAVVIPGLVDSHVHIVELGELLHKVNLIDVQSPKEAIQRALEFSKKLNQDEWLIGQGWDEGAWANDYPDKHILDKYFPERPVVLKSLHGFAVWANSKALAKAGITAQTKAPVGGEILRDDLGEPSGILLNNATNLIKNAIPKSSDARFMRALFDGLKQMSKDGYVSVHQAGADYRLITGLQYLYDTQQLPTRVYAMLSARDIPLARYWIAQGPLVDETGWLDIRSVKAYYDGALGSRGARLLEDYSDTPGHKGVSGDAYGFDGQVVKDLMQAGFQVGIHAIGDAGNRETLDYFEKVYAQIPATRSQRNRIEHAQVISPEDFQRMADYKIIASMEPPHAVEDKAWAEERLGPGRIKNAYAWRTLRKQNVALTFNSDLPGSDHSIFYGLHAAITRRDKNAQPLNGWYPEQNMRPEEALRAYTSWAAYSAFREQDTGILAKDRWADITVMDIDPLALGENDPEKILQGKILMTVVAGKIVHQAE